ncbi:MAG TPA: paraslipin [Sulfurimonas sp.]|nr:paraslipin [Sulfurimonas sp.]
MEAVSVIGIAIVIAVFIMMVKGIKIVPQAHAYVVERLGKYNATLEGGFHIIIPVIDTVAMQVTKQEQIIDIPQQSVITKDNVNISVDGLVFIQVENAKMATYGVVDFKRAIANLATTSLRAEIGQLALDETLSSRDTLNRAILVALDEASQKWGIKTMRVELRDISVPVEIEEAMNLQMKAEREKRAIELTATANKEATIREAEGERQKAFLQAEAIERMADAKKYEQEKTAEGQAKGMVLINQAMATNPETAEFLLAKDRIAAFNEMAKNESNDKVIIPYEATEFIGSLSILTSMLGKNKEVV